MADLVAVSITAGDWDIGDEIARDASIEEIVALAGSRWEEMLNAEVSGVAVVFDEEAPPTKIVLMEPGMNMGMPFDQQLVRALQLIEGKWEDVTETMRQEWRLSWVKHCEYMEKVRSGEIKL